MICQDESQKLLFGDPTFVVDPDAEPQEGGEIEGDESCSETFFETIRAQPRLRSLVRRVGLSGGHAHAGRLLKFLASSSLPNLQHVEGLPWHARAIPPPPIDKPFAKSQLHTLTLLQLEPGPGDVHISSWFDLSNLQEFEYFANSDDITPTLLEGVSASLKKATFHLFEMTDLDRLVELLARFSSLDTLRLNTQNATCPLTSTVLSTFPTLRQLDVHHETIEPLFELPHASLERLTLGGPPCEYELSSFDYPPDHPIYKHIDTLVDVVKNHPDRFPALQTMGVLPLFRSISFGSAEERQASGVQFDKISQKLAEVGLSLVDDEGTRW